MTRFALISGGTVAAVVEQTEAPTLPGTWVECAANVGPGYTYAGGVFTSPAAAVPSAVTMRQARLALNAAGKLTAVDTAINALSEPTKTQAKITWEYSTEVQRENGLVSQLAPALGLSGADVDALFLAARVL